MTTVVFDARDPPPDRPREYQWHGMTVRYAVGYEDADTLLEELIQLFLESKATFRATQIETAILKDDSGLKEFLISNDLWGGSGSIADDRVTDDPKIRRRIENLLIQIGDIQMRNGFVNVRTEMWVSAFKDCSKLKM